MRCDEVMPYLRNVGQGFGLEVHYMPFIVKFPLTVPVGQHPKDLGIVGMLMEPIIGLRVNWFYVIVSIHILRTEVYQHPTHPDPFQYVGSEIGVELSYHTCGSWARRLTMCSPSFFAIDLRKKSSEW